MPLRLFRRYFFCLTTLVAALSLTLTALGAPTGDGWQTLWQNQDGAARTAFLAVLKRHPTDPQALRGLALARLETDDEKGALAAWRSLCRVAPDQDMAAYWPQFAETAQESGRWDLLQETARAILASGSAPPALRSSAHLALAAAAERTGNAALASREWQALGYIRQWQVIGPFDNTSLSGFDKVSPPEHTLDPDGSYPGKDDHTVRWRPLALVAHDGQCAVGKSLSDGESNVFFAATALHLVRAQSAHLQFDPTGASKIYLNGTLVFSDALYRSHQDLLADPFSVSVTLRAGDNTVLVKLADDEKLTAAFALRVTAADSAPLTGLTVGALRTASPVQATPESSGVPPTVPVETVWAEQAGHRPPGPETAFLRGDLLRRAADYQASADVLRLALKSDPEVGWLHWQLAQTLEADGQTDEAHAERSQALQEDPHLVDATLDSLLDDGSGLSVAERISRLQALQKFSAASPDTAWALAQAYREAKLSGPALAAGRQATALADGDEAVIRLSRMYGDLDRPAEAARLLTNALQKAPGSADILQEMAETLASDNDPTPAIAVYTRLLSVDPTSTATRTVLAKLYVDHHDPAAAVQSLRHALQERPQNGSIRAELADVLLEQGQRHAAASLYQEAIQLDPAEITLRDKFAVLSGEKPAIDLATPTPSGPILASAAKVKDAGGASALMLLDEGRTVVYPDYATLTRYHQIIKVFDQSGVEHYQSYALGRPGASATATVESARLIKADGEVRDVTDSQDTSDDESSSVAFPSLSPGDVIDVTYRVENYRKGALAHQFWDQWSFDGTSGPSRISRYVLIAPKSVELRTVGHGAVPSPSTKDVGSWRIREWHLTDIPARPVEVDGVGFTDAALWLDLSTVASWREIVAWYQDLSSPRCIPDATVRAKAAELTKDCHTEAEKIQILTAFISHDIQYQSSPFRMSAYVPTEGKQVLRERYGDCKDKAALLTAMLAAVGIQSDMVLLSPRSHGLTPYLPSPRFNHAIARVQTAHGPLWIDATADQIEFGDLPTGDQQVPALVIDSATSDLTQTPVLPPSGDLVDDNYACTLDSQGQLHGQSDWTMRGGVAWGMRSIWREVPAGKQDEAMRYITSGLLKDSSYDKGSLENLTQLDKPLLMHVQYHADHYSTTAGNFVLTPLPWSDFGRDKTLEQLKATPGRTQGMEVADDCGHFHSVLDLTMSNGYVPQDLPAEVHADSAFGSYRFTYRMQGAVLHAERDLTLTSLRVPAASLTSYMIFIQDIETESQRRLVFKKS